jgi:hypothetical protein
MALPYTRTGDIVIACNPYQWLTYLYTEEQQLLYAKKLVWDNSDLDNRKILEPHVYESSALAYKGLAARGTSQSLLVSGESGAGKTETVKICMNHMASLQRGPVEAGDMAEGVNPVVQRVVDSNPLLEAFGNAKTTTRLVSESIFYSNSTVTKMPPTARSLLPNWLEASVKCTCSRRVAWSPTKSPKVHITSCTSSVAPQMNRRPWFGAVSRTPTTIPSRSLVHR